MNAINVGIDIDGVLAAYSKRFSQVMRELYGEQMPLISNEGQEVPYWNWRDWYPATQDQIALVDKTIAGTFDFWKSLETTNADQVKYLVENLDNHPKINVYFVTNRLVTAGDTVVHQSIKSLESFGWTNPQVIVTSQKGVIARALDLKFFIDDMAENCANIALYSPSTTVFIIDKAHNRFLHAEQFGIKRIAALNPYADAVLKYIDSQTKPNKPNHNE